MKGWSCEIDNAWVLTYTYPSSQLDDVCWSLNNTTPKQVEMNIMPPDMDYDERTAKRSHLIRHLLHVVNQDA